MWGLALLLVLVFSSPVEEERTGLFVSVHLCVNLACVTSVFSSSSFCSGLAADCDCGTPWTFHLTF